MSVVQRLFPRRIDNGFTGRRPALWLLGLFIALKLVMSVNSILATADVAAGADGFRLETYGEDGAAAVLMLFALGAVDQFVLALLGLAVLVRYRAMVPFVYLVLLADQIGRRVVIQAYDIARAGENAAAVPYLVYGLLALLVAGFVLSLVGRPPGQAQT